jgi:glycosyltransferase involved in cell wall biosynthesis
MPAVGGSLGTRLRHAPASAAGLIHAAYATRHLSRRHHADLVHAQSIRAGVAATLAARFPGPPVIVHVHDCLPSRRVANLTRRIVSRGASTIFANSAYTARNFTQSGRHLAVRVVYNPVDVDRFDPRRLSREEARARLGLDLSSPLLGMVAQITPWKGQDDAIRALALLRATHPNARLLLVGGIPFVAGTRYDNAAFLARLRRMVVELGLADAVTFLGERQDIPQILRALDVVLVPSWEEPFGIALVEAMAMEVAVIATAVGGPAEIITDGQDGILLEPRRPPQWAAAVAALIDEPERRAEMGRRARRQVVARFRRETYVETVLGGYRELLERGA